MHPSIHNSTQCIATAQRILEQPKFLSRHSSSNNDPVSLLPIEFFETIVRFFIRYILEPILRLFNVVTPEIDSQSPITLIIFAVAVIMVLFLAVIVTIKIIRQRKPNYHTLHDSPSNATSAEAFMESAEHAAARNDFSLAIRLLASATIRMLQRQSSVQTLECKTFKEILHTYRRAPFQQQLSIIFSHAEMWYRNAIISQDNYHESAAAYHSLAVEIAQASAGMNNAQ